MNQGNTSTICDLSAYGQLSTKHLNSLSMGNPMGLLNILGSGLEMQAGNLNILNSSTLYISGNSKVNIGDDAELNVGGCTTLHDVLIYGNLAIWGDITHLTPEQNVTVGNQHHLIFGKEEEGAWRITIIDGLMHIQKHNGTGWITKSTIN